MPLRLAALIAVLLALLPRAAPAESTLIAVATNFIETAEAIEPGFEAATGHEITFTAGSTGKLYAQIVAGAPFDAFLAADAARPARLVAEGLGAGEAFTYATGRLALLSAEPGGLGQDPEATLAAGGMRSLAIANPELAPYGLAAREALMALGLWERLSDRIVMGENIGQAYALVATGNAPMGFVALASLRSPRASVEGDVWEVPATLHAPIRQDAVLLSRAADNAAARAFLDWLRGPEARVAIERFGYAAE